MKYKLRWKLFFSMILSLGLIMVIGFLNWRNIYNEIVIDFGGNYARNHIQWQKERIKGVVERDLTLAKGLAHSDLLKRWLTNELNKELMKTTAFFINHYRVLFLSKTVYLVSNISLNYYYIDERNKQGDMLLPLKTLKEGKPEDEWYYVTLSEQNGFTLNVDFDKEVGKTNLWINVKVSENENILGVIGTGYDISSFINDFVNVPEEGIESFILLEDGAVFAAKEDVLMNYRIVAKDEANLKRIYSLIPENQREFLKKKIKNAVLNPDEVVLTPIIYNGKSHIAAFSYIPTVKWLVFSAIDITDVYSMEDLAMAVLFLFFSIIFVFFLLGLVLEMMILKPVRELTDGAIRIENGDYEISFPKFQKDEMGRLKEIFIKMAEEIKNNIVFLEQKVKERTEELSKSRKKITTLLNSSGEGFLKFGENLRVDEEYSKMCLKIFRDKIEEKKIDEILFSGDKNRQNSFQQILKGIFQQKKLFLQEIMLDLLPSQASLYDRTYRLKFHLEDSSSIILIMEDITDQIKLTKQVDLERRQLLFVVEYMKDEIGIKELLDDFHQFISNIDRFEIETIYRKLHTFKGNFLQKGFLNIPEAIHEAEGKIQDAMNNGKDEPKIETWKILENLNKDMKLINEYLETNITKDTLVKVSLKELKKLEEKVKDIHSDLYKEIFLLTKSSLKNYFQNYERTVERLSAKENKQIQYQVVCEDDIFVYLPDYYSVLSVFYHLITNAVTHGIEIPEMRLIAGKNEEGQITIVLMKDEKWITIIVKDDGKGIDISYFQKKYGHILPDQFDFIFQNFVSSSKEITEYSGRGAGMGAVKAEIEKFGGTIEIKSNLNEGTEIKIKIPYKE